MTSKDLAKVLAERTGLAEAVAETFLSEAFKSIGEALAENNEVSLNGLGHFAVKKRSDGPHLEFKPAPELNMLLTGGSSSSQRRPPIDAKASSAEQYAEKDEDDSVDVDAQPGLVVESARLYQVHQGDTDIIQASTSSRRSDGTSDSGSRKTELSSVAEDLLGLDAEDLVRGLGLTKNKQGKTLQQQGRVTFPVQIAHQMKDESHRTFRPADGEERRSLKGLTLKNFFLSIGSIVRDKETHEPLIVFDVADKAGPKGESYTPRLLRITGSRPGATGGSHSMQYEEVDFNCDKHEVLMVLDPQMGPRPHAFDVGSLTANDRRGRAETCLAQEYQIYKADKIG